MKLCTKGLINLIFESRGLGVVLGGVAQGPDDDDDDADRGDADDGDCHWFLCVCLRVCVRALQ